MIKLTRFIQKKIIFWFITKPFTENDFVVSDSFVMNHNNRCGVMVITTAQLHSTKSDLRLCTGSNPAHDVSEIYNGENL